MIEFELPDALSADRPPEARGVPRDQVRLLMASPHGRQHARFADLGRFLRRGDLIVVNTSATLAAAVDAIRIPLSGRPEPVVVHIAAELDDGWVIELRTAPAGARPLLIARPGERIQFEAGTGRTLRGPTRAATAAVTAKGTRLWRAAGAEPRVVHELMNRRGRPIRYGYVGTQWPLSAYQTVFAREPGSAEMPSAARPFTYELVTRLIGQGVLFAPVLLHCGVSSLEAHEPPPAERFAVTERTAELVNHVKARGGRVIAAGTTVTRALESATDGHGRVRPADGWTDLVLGPDRPARAVTGLITGLHAPGASHLLLLEAVAGRELVRQSYAAALQQQYLWHEFGDSCLLLPLLQPPR